MNCFSKSNLEIYQRVLIGNTWILRCGYYSLIINESWMNRVNTVDPRQSVCFLVIMVSQEDSYIKSNIVPELPSFQIMTTGCLSLHRFYTDLHLAGILCFLVLVLITTTMYYKLGAMFNSTTGYIISIYSLETNCTRNSPPPLNL